MKLKGFTVVVLLLAVVSSGDSGAAQSTDDLLRQQVRTAEQAFARSMAARDFKAFGDLVADEAVFFGRDGAQRGKSAVLAGWKSLFDGPTAPFSWEPDTVEVLATGTLGISSGPVRDPGGKQTGVFNSIWRREPNGQWKVVFDKGCPVCDCPTGN